MNISNEKDYKKFLDSYLEAALWADGEEFENGETWSKESIEQAEKDCYIFCYLAHNRHLLENLGADRAGLDFWLTRNYHGAGFWDRGLGEQGEKLTELAQTFKGLNLYAKCGRIYFEG